LNSSVLSLNPSDDEYMRLVGSIYSFQLTRTALVVVVEVVVVVDSIIIGLWPLFEFLLPPLFPSLKGPYYNYDA